MPSNLDSAAPRGLLGGVPRASLEQGAFLLLGFFLLAAVPGGLLFGAWGVAAAAFLTAAAPLAALHLPPEAMTSLYRAKRIPPDGTQLSDLFDVLSKRANLARRPCLHVVPSATLSAFATGSRKRPAVAVTEGLLRRLSLAETAGILAHEVAHIRHDDLPLLGLADVLSRMVQVLGYGALALALFNVMQITTGEDAASWWAVLVLYLAPALFSLLQLALPRTREFEADRTAVALTGDAQALASALRRVDTYTGHLWEDLMLPVPARRVPYPSLLRSHPEAELRIRQLTTAPEASPHARSGGPPVHAPLVIVEEPMLSLVGYGPGTMRPRYRWPGLWF